MPTVQIEATHPPTSALNLKLGVLYLLPESSPFVACAASEVAPDEFQVSVYGQSSSAVVYRGELRVAYYHLAKCVGLAE